jgi:hypothetical protein
MDRIRLAVQGICKINNMADTLWILALHVQHFHQFVKARLGLNDCYGKLVDGFKVRALSGTTCWDMTYKPNLVCRHVASKQH